MPKSHLRVLLVEDSPSDARLLLEQLTQVDPEQFEVTHLERLEDALARLKEQPFDVVLLDLSLPDSAGQETFLRAEREAPHVPLVVLSGTSDEMLGIEAVQHGIQDYLVKGQAGGPQIARTIRYAIERKRMGEALRQARDEMELRVEERTVELTQTVDTLQSEVIQRALAEQSLRERSDQLRLLASELTLAEQRERQRLAHVLHDGLQQLLVSAKFRLAMMERTAKEKEAKRAAKEVSELIDESIETSRSLTADLSPPILSEGLVPALEWLVRWVYEKHGLAIDLQAHGDVEPGAEDVTVLMFQAARELLFNVAKHARTKAARMHLTRSEDQIQLSVTDEGVGFDPAQLRAEGGRSGGFGLFSIHERLNLLGGRMEVVSAPGRGSRFTLIAPSAAQPRGSAAGAQAPHISIGVSSTGKIPPAVAGSRIRIVLVDDHMVVRQGLARLVREEADMEIVGEASDGESAVSLIRQVQPDVVLMDISMPRMTGIEATRIIHAELPDVRIIGLSMFEEAERAEAMRRAGAVAFLTKSGPSDAVIAAIRACARSAEARAAAGTPKQPDPKTLANNAT